MMRSTLVEKTSHSRPYVICQQRSTTGLRRLQIFFSTLNPVSEQPPKSTDSTKRATEVQKNGWQSLHQSPQTGAWRAGFGGRWGKGFGAVAGAAAGSGTASETSAATLGELSSYQKAARERLLQLAAAPKPRPPPTPPPLRWAKYQGSPGQSVGRGLESRVEHDSGGFSTYNVMKRRIFDHTQFDPIDRRADNLSAHGSSNAAFGGSRPNSAGLDTRQPRKSSGTRKLPPDNSWSTESARDSQRHYGSDSGFLGGLMGDDMRRSGRYSGVSQKRPARQSLSSVLGNLRPKPLGEPKPRAEMNLDKGLGSFTRSESHSPEFSDRKKGLFSSPGESGPSDNAGLGFRRLLQPSAGLGEDGWASTARPHESKPDQDTASSSSSAAIEAEFLDDLGGKFKWNDELKYAKPARAVSESGATPEAEVEQSENLVVDNLEFDTFEDKELGRRRSRDRERRECSPEDVSEPVPKKRRKKVRRDNHLEEDDWPDYDEEVIEARKRRKAERRAERERERMSRMSVNAEPERLPEIVLPEFISVANLATALGVKNKLFLKDLNKLGFEDINQESIMTGETAALVAQEYGFEPTIDTGEGEDLKPRPLAKDVSALPPRPPVVTIMGHVDHGKTTLLDYLRKSSIVSQEHGGITQHIGAFSVRLSSGKAITFLDTPGHAAFLSMRQRGANVTDIVVLVVAADDSVKPQTLEALKHARAAQVPIIVAISKVDLDASNVEQVKADLARNGVEIEEYGGDVQVVCVSGLTGKGMEDLEENILLLSEILDMRAERDGMVEGWVLESTVKPVGRSATVLVKRGTLRQGDHIVAGTVYTKVRVLRNEAGVEIKEAAPGTPVEVLGWKIAPNAGDMVLQAADERTAKRAVRYRLEVGDRGDAMKQLSRQEVVRREREEKEAVQESVEEGKEDVEAVEASGTKLANFLLKADVHGSVEAVQAAMMELGSHEVRVNILHAASGLITESEVEHATTTHSTVVNFNQPIAGQVRVMAEKAGVQILDHKVIYHVVDEVKEHLSKMLKPILHARVLAEADILKTFRFNMEKRIYKMVAGCRVRTGQLTSSSLYRVLRKGEIIWNGTLESLKQGQQEKSQINKGSECGLMFAGWEDFQEGDQVQAYEEWLEQRKL